MHKEEKNIRLSFQELEEFTALFLLDDLIKEYNSQMIDRSPFRRKPFLSLKDRDLNAKNPIIRPMTLAEIEAMRVFELSARDMYFLRDILKQQYSPFGLVSNVPTIAAGATLIEVIHELGLKGKVTYKTVDNKTYVIVKGLAKDRTILKGTRYLNTHPDIVRLGLAKVSFSEAYKTGFKTSVLIYGGIKLMEGVKAYLDEDSSLDIRFFSKMGTDIPKLAISSLVAGIATGTVSTIGFPVVLGTGLVIVAGFGSGILLELLDKQIGLTEKLSDAVETMWNNLKKNKDLTSQKQEKQNTSPDLLEGLVFDSPTLRFPRIIQKGGFFVYTA